MSPTIRAAHDRLTEAFNRLNYNLKGTTSAIPDVAVRDNERRYVFSWHFHENHLLFYLRNEALSLRSTLRTKALTYHARENVNRNPGKETTITLRSDEEAEILLRWLLPMLPL